MNFLADYGSDSDEETLALASLAAPAVPSMPIAIVVPPTQCTVHIAQSKHITTSTGNGNKKKLNISFLPAEIQAALMRNESLKDSDDEDDYMHAAAALISTNASSASSAEPYSCDLLHMLPKPKQQEGGSFGPDTFATAVRTKVDASQQQQQPAVTTTVVPVNTATSSFKYQQAMVEEISVKKTPMSSSSSSLLSNTVSSRASIPVHAASTSIFHAAKSSILPVIAPPIEYAASSDRDRNNRNDNTYSDINCSSSGDTNTNMHRIGFAPSTAYDYSSYPSCNQTYDFNGGNVSVTSSFAGSISSSESSNKGTPVPNSKKRGRELEQQLMSGNLDALAHSSSVRSVVNANSTWNADQYMDQQKQEQIVRQSFGVGTTIKAINQVSKTESRKHQLGSLAIKAAQTELAMLDARGNRNKTKSETQGKYGW